MLFLLLLPSDLSRINQLSSSDIFKKNVCPWVGKIYLLKNSQNMCDASCNIMNH